MKNSQKRFLGAMLATSSVLGVVAPSMTAIASVKDEVDANVQELRDVINENLPKLKKDPKFSTFHKILYAADRLRIYNNLNDEANRVMGQIAQYSDKVHTPEIISIIDKMNNFSETKKMQMYDDLLEKDIPALTKIDADAAQYLTERLDSWGTAVVFEADPNYAKATDAILKVTELRKDKNKKEALKQIDVAKEAIKDMKTYKQNGDYLNAKLKVEVNLVDKISNGGGGGGSSSVGSSTKKAREAVQAYEDMDLTKMDDALHDKCLEKKVAAEIAVEKVSSLNERDSLTKKINVKSESVEKAFTEFKNNNSEDSEAKVIAEATTAVEEYEAMKLEDLTLENIKEFSLDSKIKQEKANSLINQISAEKDKKPLQDRVDDHAKKIDDKIQEVKNVVVQKVNNLTEKTTPEVIIATLSKLEIEEFNENTKKDKVAAEFITIKGDKTYKTIDEIKTDLTKAVNKVNEVLVTEVNKAGKDHEAMLNALSELDEFKKVDPALEYSVVSEFIAIKGDTKYKKIGEVKTDLAKAIDIANKVEVVKASEISEELMAALNNLEIKNVIEENENAYWKEDKESNIKNINFKDLNDRASIQAKVDEINEDVKISRVDQEKVNGINTAGKDFEKMKIALRELDEFKKVDPALEYSVVAEFIAIKGDITYKIIDEVKTDLVKAIDAANKVEAVKTATTSGALIAALNNLKLDDVVKENENAYWKEDKENNIKNINFKNLNDKASIQAKVKEINEQPKVTRVKDAGSEDALFDALIDLLKGDIVKKANKVNYWADENKNFKDLKDAEAIEAKVIEINKNADDAKTEQQKVNEVNEAGKNHEAMVNALNRLDDFKKVDPALHYDIASEFIEIKGDTTYKTIDEVKTDLTKAIDNVNLLININNCDNNSDLMKTYLGKLDVFNNISENDKDSVVKEFIAIKGDKNYKTIDEIKTDLTKAVNKVNEVLVTEVNKAGKDHEAMLNALNKLDDFKKVDPALQYDIVSEVIEIKGNTTYNTIDEMKTDLAKAIANANFEDKTEFIQNVNTTKDTKEMTTQLGKLKNAEFDSATTTKDAIVAKVIANRDAKKPYTTVQEIKEALTKAINDVNKDIRDEADFIEKINTTEDVNEMTTKLGALQNAEFNSANTTKDAIVAKFMTNRDAKKPYTTIQEIKEALTKAINDVNQDIKDEAELERLATEATEAVEVYEAINVEELKLADKADYEEKEKSATEAIGKIDKSKREALNIRVNNKKALIDGKIKQLEEKEKVDGEIKAVNDAKEIEAMKTALENLDNQDFKKLGEKENTSLDSDIKLQVTEFVLKDRNNKTEPENKFTNMEEINKSIKDQITYRQGLITKIDTVTDTTSKDAITAVKSILDMKKFEDIDLAKKQEYAENFIKNRINDKSETKVKYESLTKIQEDLISLIKSLTEGKAEGKAIALGNIPSLATLITLG